jgi:hypothetical protein
LFLNDFTFKQIVIKAIYAGFVTIFAFSFAWLRRQKYHQNLFIPFFTVGVAHGYNISLLVPPLKLRRHADGV